jgi:hypothetical protein
MDEKNRGGISTFSWMVDGLKSAYEARHCGGSRRHLRRTE